MKGNVVFLGFAAGGAPGISAAVRSPHCARSPVGVVCGAGWSASRERTFVCSFADHQYVETALLLTAAGAAAFAAGDSSLAPHMRLSCHCRGDGAKKCCGSEAGCSDLTTTVLTMTIHRLAADVPPRRRPWRRWARRALSILAMFRGCPNGASFSTFGCRRRSWSQR